jgi:hypothetical protein
MTADLRNISSLSFQEGCCVIRSIREIRGRAVQAFPQISQMTADLHNTSSLLFPARLLPYPLHPRNPWKKLLALLSNPR